MRRADGSAYGESAWNDPSNDYTFSSDEVHVWRVDLRSDRHDFKGLRSLLSADERQRADRFLRPEHADYFTAGRGTLRNLLAACTGGDAHALHFDYNEFGKPELKLTDNPERLVFNVSHTGSFYVVAVCRHASVGIDIESYRSTLELEKLAHRYFSPAEVSALMALSETRREEAFYRCWSSKEAFMKVIGQGLSIGLNNFEVEVDPDKKPYILSVPVALRGQGPWESAEVPMGDRLSGVLTVAGELGDVHFFRYAH